MKKVAFLILAFCVLVQNRGYIHARTNDKQDDKIDYASMADSWEEFCDNNYDSYPTQCNVSSINFILDNRRQQEYQEGNTLYQKQICSRQDIQWAETF